MRTPLRESTNVTGESAEQITTAQPGHAMTAPATTIISVFIIFLFLSNLVFYGDELARASHPLYDPGPFHSTDDIAALESDIAISRREFAEGKGIPNDVVFDEIHGELLSHLNKRVAQ